MSLEQESETRAKTRWGIRFSLRGLVVATTVSGLVLGFGVREMQFRNRLVKRVESKGGALIYAQSQRSVARWGIGKNLFRHVDELTLSNDEPATHASGQFTDDDLTLVCRLGGLKRLTVGSEAIRDAALSRISRLDELESLKLNCPNVTDKGLAEALGGLDKLVGLELLCSRATAATLEVVCRLPSLESLTLRAGKVGDDGLLHLQHAPNLKTLHLYGKDHYGVIGADITPAALSRLQGCDKLEELWIYSLHLTDKDLAPLAEIPTLKTLNIQGSLVSYDDAAALQKELPGTRIIVTTGGGQIYPGAGKRSAPVTSSPSSLPTLPRITNQQ